MFIVTILSISDQVSANQKLMKLNNIQQAAAYAQPVNKVDDIL